MKLARTTAAAAVVTATLVAGALAVAGPAYAASYGSECGSGYAVVNSAPIGSAGTVFLTYSAATGRNCVVAKRNTAGSAVLIEAGLGLHPVGSEYQAYEGNYFTSYAGPIYLSAADHCVDWMGRINSVEGGKRGTNCG